MTEQEMLDAIGSYDYGVYTISNAKLDPKAHFAVADPLSLSGGFYLEAPTIGELYTEMVSAGIILDDED